MSYEDYIRKLDELPYGKLGFTLARQRDTRHDWYTLYRGRYIGYRDDFFTLEEACHELKRQLCANGVFVRPSWWDDEKEAIYEAA